MQYFVPDLTNRISLILVLYIFDIVFIHFILSYFLAQDSSCIFFSHCLFLQTILLPFLEDDGIEKPRCRCYCIHCFYKVGVYSISQMTMSEDMYTYTVTFICIFTSINEYLTFWVFTNILILISTPWSSFLQGTDFL